ncbi:MAG: hypothetical protein SFU56_05265 [Capsulimonadales bacterium]|nr:hypothetical protein [Capsulimonadales bacterium]
MLTGAAILIGSAVPAFAQVPAGTQSVSLTPTIQRDYLVESGKRPVRASERLRSSERRTPVSSPVASEGQFVRNGKSLVWVPNEQLPDYLDQLARSRKVATSETRPSSGRFIRQGKALIWQENEG